MNSIWDFFKMEEVIGRLYTVVHSSQLLRGFSVPLSVRLIGCFLG